MKMESTKTDSPMRTKGYWAAIATIAGVNITLAFYAIGMSLSGSSGIAVIEASRATVISMVPILFAVFSRRLQNVIAHFKLKDPLPGCRALELAGQDHRIDVKKLKNGETVPPRGKRQNAWWYDRYKKVKNDPAVVVAQRRFLLFRDLAFAQAIAAMVLLIVTITCHGPISAPIIAVAFYALFVLATRNRGEQFVQTAMAVWTP